MTALTDDFEEFNPPRFTEWMHYPLPPETPRPKIKFNGWKQYLLPSPSTGRATGFARATTVSKTLEDTYNLSAWSRRETANRIYALSQMPPETQLHPRFETTADQALERLQEAGNTGKVGDIDKVLDTIDNLMGGADARELGECVHAWIEALTVGLVLLKDVPAIVRPHILAARAVLKHRGIILLPQYAERVVINDRGEETVAGKVDHIGMIVSTGELVVVDVKTSKVSSLEYSWLNFAVQVGGVYTWATNMLALDGKSWEPMPEIRQDIAVVLHVPSDQPERAAALTINTWWGAEVMVEAITARARRKEAKVQVPKGSLPVPTRESLRYVEARMALSEIETVEDGQQVYDTFEDIWDDELSDFAGKVVELL